VSLLVDATKGLQTRPDEQVYDELRRRGVEITTFEQWKAALSRSRANVGAATHKS
jgi:hypothetical protein